MKGETKFVTGFRSEEYEFEVWKEGRKFYANAKTNDSDIWLYKWTVSKTFKSVVSTIRSFAPDAYQLN